MKTVALSLAIAMTATGAMAQAAPNAATVAKGKAVAQRACASCHAIGPVGKSMIEGAPAFRELGRHYDYDGLPVALKTGVAPQMPQIILKPADATALVVYMKALQAPAPVKKKTTAR